MILCLVYKTKLFGQSCDTIWDAIKKLTIQLFLKLENFWYLYKDSNKLFKPNTSKRTFFLSICPIDDRFKLVECVRKQMHICILYPV